MYWANHGLVESWQLLLEASTPRQREVFGVPPSGHPYWNAETIRGMAARYPNMDMRPYTETGNMSHALVDTERARLAKLPPTSDITSRTGVVTRAGFMRDSLRALRPYLPGMAAYYERMLDYYEAVSAGPGPSGRV
jgi:hypothetical protein